MVERSHKGIEFTERDIRQVELMAGLGMALDTIAAVLDISHDTLNRVRKRDARVDEAYRRGAAKAEYNVAKALYGLCVEEKSLAAIIWFEKTRFKRSDRQELVVENNQALQPQVTVYIPDNDRGEKTVKMPKLNIKKSRRKI